MSRTHLILLLLVLISPSSVECRSLGDTSYNFRVGSDVFRGQKLPDFCLDYFSSSSAKLIPENIDRVAAQDAIDTNTENIDLRLSVEPLVQQLYANHICDATEFAPSVLSAPHELTCVEICSSCVPGSVPICFLRNPQFTALAQVCLCTYDMVNPVENAAFSLRHEKRIFSRRIRKSFSY